MYISIIIPAFNEESIIASTIKSIAALPDVDKVLVIDDGSTDRTGIKARKAGAQVITHIKNFGKGAALNTGISACKNSDIVGFLDADTGSSAVEMQKLIQPLLQNEADMTVAVFPTTEKKAGFGLVKALAYWGILLFTGKKFAAPLSGQRALNKKALSAIGNIQSGFSAEVGITVKACRVGISIKEIMVNMNHRETKRNFAGFKHRGKQFLDLLLFFVKLCSSIKTQNAKIAKHETHRKTR